MGFLNSWEKIYRQMPFYFYQTIDFSLNRCFLIFSLDPQRNPFVSRINPHLSPWLILWVFLNSYNSTFFGKCLTIFTTSVVIASISIHIPFSTLFQPFPRRPFLFMVSLYFLVGGKEKMQNLEHLSNWGDQSRGIHWLF